MKTRKPLFLVVMTLASLAAALVMPGTALGKPLHSPVGAVASMDPLYLVWALVGVACVAGLLVLSDNLWRRFRSS
jgi:hypothetical protein